MSRLEKLRNASSSHDIAKLLGYKSSTLTYILYKIPEDQKYTEFTIAKKNGGTRNIKAPTKKLRELQKRLTTLLYDCMEELLPENEQLKKDKNKQTSQRSNRAVSHGFKKGLSIASNAAKHKQKKYVLNLDIEDFFPSINFGRVRGYFIKNKDFRLNPKIATIISQIACHDNTLPQGSPCSPVISNLIGQVLDMRLVKLAKKHKCTYSRYADDLTFSTNQKAFPKELAYKKRKKKSDWVIGKKLSDSILNTGFTINASKTRMQYEDTRQIVTGLVVNRVVNTKSEYYRYARVMCQSLFMTGTFHLPPSKEEKKEAKKNCFIGLFIKIKHVVFKEIDQNTEKIDPIEFSEEGEHMPESPSIKQLEGILSHIYYVKNYRNKYAQKGFREARHDGKFAPPKHDKNSDELPISDGYPPHNRCNQYTDESHQVSVDGIKNLYAKFLFFKHFIFLDKPLIFCEGKTDNIYYECALKQLAKDYPELVEKKGKETKYKISFFNKTETVIDMLKMAEGSGGMEYILKGYKRRMKKYAFKEGKKHPVIMIADNDDAGRGLLGAAEKIASKKAKGGFIHATENLYIVLLPKVKGKKNTEPEDYFNKDTLKATLGNKKKFYRKNEGLDPTKHYGKAAFARDVIKQKQDSIKFDNFKVLLDLIKEVVSSYENLYSHKKGP